MRPTNILIVACLCLSAFVGISSGRIGDSTSAVASISKIIEKAAGDLGYRAMRGSRPSDEWEEEGKKNLLENHAYYTLFAKDSDDSCVTVDGRIGVTILIFKDEELARRHVAQRKKYHLGNIGAKILGSNADGFFLREGNGFYAVVIRGAKVILFEDRSHDQGNVIKSLSETLAKEAR